MMHSAQNRLGVEVFVPGELDKDVPCCPHGPMLMFERYFESKLPRKFYSCSACRDRKDCNFFQWVDEKVSATSEEAHREIITASKPPFSSKTCWQRLQALQDLSEDERTYCHSCGQLVLPKEKSQHKNHDVISGISNRMLATPSHLMKPLETKKYLAQYLFSTKAIDFFLDTFQKLGFKNILCVGAPRIHEAIQSQKPHREEMDSLLMDLDHRYGQFNDTEHFIHYNMFNHHFFNPKSARQCLQNFFEKSTMDSTILVMDPPFGGLVQILASSLRNIWACASKAFQDPDTTELATFFVFPYFMESHITEELTSFKISDYKVDYDNHPLYRKPHGKSTKMSPVRIFTNVPVGKIVLPQSEGYRYCEDCERYVDENNVHCQNCQNCTSKDGRVWVHCERCNKCVKQGRVHCESCNRCELENHVCERTLRCCHICGDMDHKRKNCPEKPSNKPSVKRQKISDGRKSTPVALKNKRKWKGKK